MKQKVHFFGTDSAEYAMTGISFLLRNITDVVLGSMWIGVLVLFIKFFYDYLFVFRQKAIVEDNKQYKVAYREMDKVSRKIVVALLIFLGITLCIIWTCEEEFIRCFWKAIPAVMILIPLLNNHYGNKKRFAFG